MEAVKVKCWDVNLSECWSYLLEQNKLALSMSRLISMSWPTDWPWSSPVKYQDYRSIWPYLIVKFLPYNKESDFYIFSYTVDFYIWKLNSCKPMQFVDSILKHIIWYILCIVYAFIITVYTIQRIKFPTWFLGIAGTLVGIWYEKLPQKWGIWQKCRVKSPIIPTYPHTGIVGLIIDRCIKRFVALFFDIIFNL